MENGPGSARVDLYVEALELLQQAIDHLDRANAPGQIAAHVDLAVHQLQRAIDDDRRGGTVQAENKTRHS